ncbi:ABC transporter F family member 4-like [Sceloporus undulatus]|uniref:ABC transporter F family member 4-like n=1 Tax=Sceloporus undulatus TaxID=8520 RepID=UPI001C4C1F8B|nr:ABC transporter F family member 4-like [Sceloporus undulatus]
MYGRVRNTEDNFQGCSMSSPGVHLTSRFTQVVIPWFLQMHAVTPLRLFCIICLIASCKEYWRARPFYSASLWEQMVKKRRGFIVVFCIKAQAMTRDSDTAMKTNLQTSSGSQSKTEDLNDAKRPKLQGMSQSNPKDTAEGFKNDLGIHDKNINNKLPNFLLSQPKDSEAKAEHKENPWQGPVHIDEEKEEEEEDWDPKDSEAKASNKENPWKGTVYVTADSEPIIISDEEEKEEEVEDWDVEKYNIEKMQKFKDSGMFNHVWRWVLQHQCYQHHYGDSQPHEEPHSSWVNNELNDSSHKQQYELDNSGYYDKSTLNFSLGASSKIPNFIIQQSEVKTGDKGNPWQGPVHIAAVSEPIIISDEEEEKEEEKDVEKPKDSEAKGGDKGNLRQGPVQVTAGNEPIIISDDEKEEEEEEDTVNIFTGAQHWMQVQEDSQPWSMQPNCVDPQATGEPRCTWYTEESRRRRSGESGECASENDHQHTETEHTEHLNQDSCKHFVQLGKTATEDTNGAECKMALGAARERQAIADREVNNKQT